MSEIMINATTTGVQHQPAVATLGSTHFFVVWADGSDLTIKGQIIQANPILSRGEFVVNTPTETEANTNRQLPAIAGSGFGPIVAWIETAINPPGPHPHVKLQKFDRDGQKSGPEIQVSTTDVDPNHPPAITSMVDGGFLVAWVDARRDQRIRAQRFGPEGMKKGAEFQVNTTEGFHEGPIAIRLIDGNNVIAWRSDPVPPGGGSLIFRIFDLEGSPVIAETRPNLSGFTGQKAMTLLDDGRFVIAHIRSRGMSDIGVAKNEVEAHVFEPDGASANIPILATTGGQEINSSFPTLAPLQSARFLLAWVQKKADTFVTIPSVRARVFSAGVGDSIGPEVEVNTTTTGERSSVRATSTFSFEGRDSALVAWVDAGPTGGASNFEIRGRVLPISGEGIGSN